MVGFNSETLVTVSIAVPILHQKGSQQTYIVGPAYLSKSADIIRSSMAFDFEAALRTCEFAVWQKLVFACRSGEDTTSEVNGRYNAICADLGITLEVSQMIRIWTLDKY